MRRRVALFISCLHDQFSPRVGVAVVRVLESLECDVSFPSGQTCCGQPVFHNGLHPEARALAKRWIEVFESAEAIVTPSASCCAMIRTHFQELFQDDPAWQDDAARLASRTFEFTEFLTKILRVKLTQIASSTPPAPTAVTLHSPCQLRLLRHRSASSDGIESGVLAGSGTGDGDETLKLLRQLRHVEYRAMERMDQCCGFEGTFAANYPAISRAMSEEKVEAIARTGASMTVCNEAGCAMNIAGMCRKEHVTTEVKHIAEVIAEAMGLDLSRL